MKKTILFIFLAMSLVACRQEVENARVVDKLPVLFPDYIGVTIPSTIAPMNFGVEGNVDGNRRGESIPLYVDMAHRAAGAADAAPKINIAKKIVIVYNLSSWRSLVFSEE